MSQFLNYLERWKDRRSMRLFLSPQNSNSTFFINL
nr:MAG TPA: hypothetical protein [Caudoviricetes sp.]